MPNTDAVIDISHNNGNINLANAQQAGILGVIHKATQGTTFADPMYQANMAQAQQLGLLWGAYHFGNGDDGVAQATFFLNTVQPAAGTVLVLDFESNPASSTMSLQEAKDFVSHVQAVTGIWPGIYGGSYLKEQLGSTPDPILQNCWFWLAQYGPTAVLPPGWANWTLWQYLDGSVVKDPNPIPGITPCDRDYYCDTPATLQAKWATGSLA
ncbi:MAG: glycoside hydrolase family 25 protein [Terracidiphilus sp.]